MATDGPLASGQRPVPNAIRIIVIALGAIALSLFLWKARSLVLTIFLAIVAGLALSRAADWLEQRRIKRSIGAPITMLLIIGALVGLIAAVAPTVRRQTEEMTTEVPKALRKVTQWIGAHQAVLQGGETQNRQEPRGRGQQAQRPAQTSTQQQSQNQKGQPVEQAGRLVMPAVTSTFEAIAGLVILIFVAMYIAISPNTYRDGIMHLVPHSRRGRADEVLTDVAETLRGWLVARVIAMVVIGVVTGGVLAVMKVKAALALGLIAGLLELIPFYGPIIAAIPAIGIALVDSPQKAIYVAIFYVIVQQFEGNLLSPLLLKRRLEVPPVLTVVAVSAFGIVFGVVGMLAAEPLLAATLLVVRKLYVRDVIGDDISD